MSGIRIRAVAYDHFRKDKFLRRHHSRDLDCIKDYSREHAQNFLEDCNRRLMPGQSLKSVSYTERNAEIAFLPPAVEPNSTKFVMAVYATFVKARYLVKTLGTTIGGNCSFDVIGLDETQIQLTKEAITLFKRDFGSRMSISIDNDTTTPSSRTISTDLATDKNSYFRYVLSQILVELHNYADSKIADPKLPNPPAAELIGKIELSFNGEKPVTHGKIEQLGKMVVTHLDDHCQMEARRASACCTKVHKYSTYKSLLLRLHHLTLVHLSTFPPAVTALSFGSTQGIGAAALHSPEVKAQEPYQTANRF